MTFINDIHEENMREKLYDILNEMNDNIVSVWNEYCYNTNYYDDVIEFMDCLDDFFCDMSATEILEHIDRDFSVRDYYFRNTIYGLESFRDPYEVVDVGALADYILDNEETLNSDELVEFFEEVEEQEERYAELEELAEENGSVLTVLYGDYFVNVILNGRNVKNVKAKVAN